LFKRTVVEGVDLARGKMGLGWGFGVGAGCARFLADDEEVNFGIGIGEAAGNDEEGGFCL
jgi:hypothetical protein